MADHRHDRGRESACTFTDPAALIAAFEADKGESWNRTEDGAIEFPFDAVKVEFQLQAA